MQFVERRRRRSEIRAEALDLCLEACRARGDFDAVVIADDKGLLVGASAAAGAEPADLAAILHERKRWPDGLSSVLFEAVGETFFLGALGSGRGDGKLAAAIEGARRILQSAALA